MTEGGLTSWVKITLTVRYKGNPKSNLYEMVIDGNLSNVYF